ncbi:MAG: hypothetical protein KDA84_23070, partial [Planctomycetaceae bacterium]|nr:hypothetical protein [Planctomycetaceae bacterium]
MAIAPRSEEAAEKFHESDQLDEVKQQVTVEVHQRKQTVQGGLQQTATGVPNTDTIEAKTGGDIPSPPKPRTPRVAWEAATPEPVPPQAISLEQESQALDSQMQDAEISREQLQFSNEPTFLNALATKDEAQTRAKQGPKDYRISEQETLTALTEQNREQATGELERMVDTRGQSLDGVFGAQNDAKSRDEKKRLAVTNGLHAIYNRTKLKVVNRLNKIDTDVGKDFNLAVTTATNAFRAHVHSYVEKYSGVTGWFRKAADWVTGDLPPFYAEGRDIFVASMKKALRGIGTLVTTGLTEAMQFIQEGRSEIDRFVEQQDTSLQKYAREAATDIQEQFTQLEHRVKDKQSQIVDGLAKRYEESLTQLDREIEQMKEANKSWLEKAADAVGGAIETIRQLKTLLLNVLSRVADAIGAIIDRPIEFLGNLVDGVRQGVNNFVANIATHLQQGFMDWLFGTLGEAGLSLPKTFDLQGILELALQILGLTWTNIRARAVKIVGEEVVSAMETTSEIFRRLIQEGPAGLWQMIKERITSTLDTLQESIKSYLVQSVITAGIANILKLLNPATAFIKACQAIYGLVVFFVERAQQIKSLIDAVLDSIAAIAKGNLTAAAAYVENSLARAIPVAIGFLASLLGLGSLGTTIKELIRRIQQPIIKAIDWLINKAVTLASKAGSLFRGKKSPASQSPSEKQMAEDKSSSENDKFVVSEKFVTRDGKTHHIYNKAPGSTQILMASNNPEPITKKTESLADKVHPSSSELVKNIHVEYDNYQSKAQRSAANAAKQFPGASKAQEKLRRKAMDGARKTEMEAFLDKLRSEGWIRDLRLSDERIGQPPGIWQVKSHSAQPSRLRKHPFHIWHMTSEHVIPRQVLSDISDAILDKKKSIASGGTVYDRMRTVMIYRRAADKKTSAEREMMGYFREKLQKLQTALRDGKAPLFQARKTVQTILSEAAQFGVRLTLEASEIEQGEKGSDSSTLTNKQRRG